jgi:isopenicillin-N epimerase
MHYHWALDRHVVHLNHGSYGATPRVVLDAQRRWRDLLEENPTGFFDDRYQGALDEARAGLAEFVGYDPEGLAFVTNATSGVAAVVNGLQLAEGDELLITDHAYNACRNTVVAAATRAGADVVTASIPFPGASPQEAVEAVLSRVSARTRLVLVDHVTSPTALILPVEPIIAALEPDVPVLVDGAHAPGMLALDLRALGASYYAGNLHKWVCAPKGAGFLAVAAAHRDSVRPTVISHGLNRPRDHSSMFHRLFDWTGTFDPTAWLSVPAALEMMAGLDVDGWPGVMAANRRLALEARNLLVNRLKVAAPAPDDMLGSMAAIPLDGAKPDLGHRLRAAGIVALVSGWPGPDDAVLRVSAQRYNALDEYERLAAAVLAD